MLLITVLLALIFIAILSPDAARTIVRLTLFVLGIAFALVVVVGGFFLWRHG